jgi:hypothetical protein
MMESASTYRAVQAVAPGRLELVRKPIREPDQGERGALPEGDGQRLQDRLAGIHQADHQSTL